jgi:hypothetical protein
MKTGQSNINPKAIVWDNEIDEKNIVWDEPKPHLLQQTGKVVGAGLRGLVAGGEDAISGLANADKFQKQLMANIVPGPLKKVYQWGADADINARDFMEQKADEQVKAMEGAGNIEQGAFNLVRPIPQIAGSLATGPAAPLVTGVISGGQYSREAELEGASLPQQLAYGGIMGTVEGTLSKLLPFPEMQKVFSQPFKQSLVSYLSSIPKEGLEEATSQLASGLTKQFVYKPDQFVTNGQIDFNKVRQAGIEAGQAGISGMGTAALIGVPGVAMSGGRKSVQTQEQVEPTPYDVAKEEVVQSEIKNIQEKVLAEKPEVEIQRKPLSLEKQTEIINNITKTIGQKSTEPLRGKLSEIVLPEEETVQNEIIKEPQQMTKEELTKIINDVPIGKKYPPTSRQVDWGPRQRGQGKRLGGGMVAGSMSDAPTGIKTYSNLLGSIPEYKNNSEDFRGFSQFDQIQYLKAREYGLNHNQAILYQAIQNPEFSNITDEKLQERMKFYSDKQQYKPSGESGIIKTNGKTSLVPEKTNSLRNGSRTLAKSRVSKPNEAYKLSQESTAARTNKYVQGAGPKLGFMANPLGRPQVKPQVVDSDTYSNPEMETEFKKSHGITKLKAVQKLSEFAIDFKNKATREFEHLPNGAEFAQLRSDLLQLSKQKGVSGHEATEQLRSNLIRLDPKTMGLFERKVLLDDLTREAKKENPSLPPGFTVENIIQEKITFDAKTQKNLRVQEALDLRGKTNKAVYDEWKTSSEAVGKSAPEFNEDYFHHQVLEYANTKGLVGTGKRARIPKRGFEKGRTGYEGSINTNYLEAEYEVLSQMIEDTKINKFIKSIQDNGYDIAPKIRQDYLKKLEALYEKNGGSVAGLKATMQTYEYTADGGSGNYEIALKQAIGLENLRKAGLIDWHKTIPEGYTTWQPKEGHVFFMTDTIPAKIANQLQEGILDVIGITKDDLRKTMTVGGLRKEYVVKQEVADTLDNLMQPKNDGFFKKLFKTITAGWKIDMLFHPRKWFKYNVRNVTTDSEWVSEANPKAWQRTPQATKELSEVMFKNKAMTGSLRDWFERGGMESTLYFQELGEINKLKVFEHLFNKYSDPKNIPSKVWNWYWKGAMKTTQFREAILRYANYLEYLDQMENNNGKPKNFGASDPETVMAIKDVKDRAYWMANDLLGAYDRVSVIGKELRDMAYPFWSYQEINFKRYIQFMKNQARDGNLAMAAGRNLLKNVVVKSPRMVYNVGKLAIKMSAFWAAVQVYNYLRFRDEEEELPPEVQARPHIILGRDKNGKIKYFDRIGALGDFLEWFGLDEAPQNVIDLLNGRKTIQEVALEMAKSPINKLASGANALYKLPFELSTGRSFYPDVFKPGRIRDTGLYLAKQIGIENEYKQVMGLPSRGYAASFENVAWYSVDPRESAYYSILDEKQRFQKQVGKYQEGYSESSRSNALYNLKLAMRYGDKRATQKYLEEYVMLGGTTRGMERSLKALDPLYGLGDNKKKFIGSLKGDQLNQLKMASEFYEDIVSGKKDIIKDLKKLKKAVQ